MNIISHGIANHLGVLRTLFEDPDTGEWFIDMYLSWEFPYWDMNAHDSAMFFHCNNMKVTENNGHRMLAMVWQNCARAKWHNADGDSDYSAWA